MKNITRNKEKTEMIETDLELLWLMDLADNSIKLFMSTVQRKMST